MMGGFGSIQGMINSLKLNRDQTARRKARVKELKTAYSNGKVRQKAFRGKVVPKEELEKIRKSIREKAQIEKGRRRVILMSLGTILTISLFWSIWWLMHHG